MSSELFHLGFTMRFPRALQIRTDLTIADCMTATCEWFPSTTAVTMWLVVPPLIMLAAVLEGIRSEKKRKMEDDDEYVVPLQRGGLRSRLQSVVS